MKLKIEKSIYKSYTGSSRLISGDSVVITTIMSPCDTHLKDIVPEISFEIKFKHYSGSRPFENFIVNIISKILKKFIVLDMDQYKCMSVFVMSNTTNLSLICNSVLIACLDGGIPMKSIFYSIGTNNLYIYDTEKEIMSIIVDLKENLNKEKNLAYIKEAVEYGIRDMFQFDE